jgi:transposase
MDKGFLTEQQRTEMKAILRRGSTPQRFARRVNAVLLLDKGMSCAQVAEVLFLDDDTVRGFHKAYVADGLAGLERFESGGSACDMSDQQIEAFVGWVDTEHPTSRRIAGAWLKMTCGLAYSKPGLIALMNRVGLVFRKPTTVPRVIDADAQRDFIALYDKLLNGLTPTEMVMFMDGVHPTHQSRAAGCWTRRDAPPLALATNSGRDRMNIHGAIDLATGQTVMVEEMTIDAASTIKLLDRVEARNPTMTSIYVFGDNAAYHKSKEVQEWLSRPERRVKFLKVPVYCPHLNPIERLWGVMHAFVTHNKCYATRKEFCEAILEFLNNTVPNQFHRFRDRITDNFRVIEACRVEVSVTRHLPHRSRRAAFPHRALVEGQTRSWVWTPPIRRLAASVTC